MMALGRRSILGTAVGSALTCTAMVRNAVGAVVPRIDPPVIDKLVIQVVVDGQHDIFIPEQQIPGLAIRQNRLQAGPSFRETLQSEWGLSLHLISQKGPETRRFLLDFAFTPDVLNNNLALLGIDLAAIDALVLSHGHLDHWGGLPGFLQKHGPSMRPGLKLYVGGEDAFCQRVTRGPGGSISPFGMLDRRELAGLGVQVVASEDPLVIDDHAFTTGVVPRTSIERVLPNSQVVFGARNGDGCDVARYAEHHFTPAELSGEPQPDQHLHEHATCFNVRGRGLVIITSCGHGGIINTVRRAREVTGIQKVHALVGGFHLAPAPTDYLARIMAELKALDIEHVFPMHCSGSNFLDLAKREIPQALVLCTTGSQFTFGA